MPKNNTFDRMTELAAALFEAPIALITAVDDERQWFRSNRGFGADQTTAQESFCRHMVGSEAGSTMVVEDATLDARFFDNRLVTDEGVRFYAGAVITTADGHQDGAVCVIDTVARSAPTDAQMESLKLLARLAGQEIDHSKLLRRQAEHTAMLEMSEAMAGVGHWRYDLKTGQVTWSDEVFRIHGLEPQSLDPTTHSRGEQYHPEDRVQIWTMMERAGRTGEGYDTRLRLYREGEERVTRTFAKAERDETGAIVALFGVFQDITDSVRAQDRIAESEALFRVMSETATDIIARYKPDGTFLYLSPSVEGILGYRPDQMVGRNCADFVPAEETVRVRAVCEAYLRAGPGATPPRFEYRATRADGAMIWLEASPRAVWDEAGRRVLELHDHVRDVTARKAAERAQAELVETLGMVEELAGVGCWRLDLATGGVTWSPEVYRIHGVTPGTFDPSLGDAVAFYHPDDRQAVQDWCAQAIETGEASSFQLRLIRSDGEERIVASQCHPQRDETGETIALFGVFQDVTETVRSQEAIAASQARYRLLAETSTDVVARFDAEGRFLYVSPSVRQVLGREPADMLGKDCTGIIVDEDLQAVRARLVAYVAAGPDAPAPRYEYRALKADGTQIWLEATPRAVRDELGRLVEFHDCVRDVTARKALEEALIAARDVAQAAATAKSEFLANMSHELRTPLTSIIGFSGLLQASEALPETERRFADRIGTASDALLSVINDILDYSKLEAGAVGLDPVAFDPADMARGAAAMLEAQCDAKGLTLTLEIDPELPDAIMGDEGRLRQVALNFLSNAVKFTGSGEVRLAMGMSGDRLRVAVADSGIGIAPDKIDALFERFTQADASTTRVYGGTGLGLAISRRLIEMMGGEIGATSELGQGSVFWFEVPLVAAEAVGSLEAEPAATLSAELRILMADDAAANRELVRIMLEPWGVRLDTVNDGAEAVQAVASGAYDVVLMDVHMPVMDGMDATRHIRAMGGSLAMTPILALTANIQPEQVEACREAGMDGHVGKPIHIAALVEALARVSRHPAPAGSQLAA
ncbi:MAG: PAS domain S-box protein [Pseudomonadota bacterium]